jgi:hypothetical protein
MSATTIIANANEIMPSCAIVNGASPPTISVAGTEPTPTKTSSAVPTTSATSFCEYDKPSMLRSSSGPSSPPPDAPRITAIRRNFPLVR